MKPSLAIHHPSHRPHHSHAWRGSWDRPARLDEVGVDDEQQSDAKGGRREARLRKVELRKSKLSKEDQADLDRMSNEGGSGI